MKIQDKAKDLVTELIRETYNDLNIVINGSNNHFNTLEDKIAIWYQVRNCLAHRGDCVPYVPTICDSSNRFKSECRRMHNEAISRNLDGVAAICKTDMNSFVRNVVSREVG